VTKEYETNPNFIPYTNTLDGAISTTATMSLWGEYLKSKGGTTVYSVGSGDPQGAAAATALIISSQSVGLKKGVLTTDLPPGTTNFTAEAQKAKSAGVDALALPLNPSSSLAVLQAMKQAGVQVKASLLLAGYDPSVLKQAGSLLEGASFAIFFAPFEDKLPAQQAYKDALAKYTKASVGMFTMVGWLSADLMIKGIQDAGSCPSGQNILAAINNLKGYTADGLIPPTNFTPADRGKSPTCAYFATVRNGAFVPDNNGQPICAKDAKLIPLA
jgi:branched-chain amino acid transport system substrate-binding protein